MLSQVGFPFFPLIIKLKMELNLGRFILKSLTSLSQGKVLRTMSFIGFTKNIQSLFRDSWFLIQSSPQILIKISELTDDCDRFLFVIILFSKKWLIRYLQLKSWAEKMIIKQQYLESIFTFFVVVMTIGLVHYSSKVMIAWKAPILLWYGSVFPIPIPIPTTRGSRQFGAQLKLFKVGRGTCACWII